MNPFSRHLQQLRSCSGLRQSELAALVGYEQSYLSALEAGVKGPPTAEFVSRLSLALQLTESQINELQDIVEASQRRYVLPVDCSEEVFYLFRELRTCLPGLPTDEAKLLTGFLRLMRERAGTSFAQKNSPDSPRKAEAQM
ncbi:helix-turn-helix transcriptional regulator [Silvimonas sp.]|uniref:helix-turn-helix domain-containing protein n=1 Tax=Silvimonas sp. TaxID=2650811 RepID=UPI00284C70DF|nr:helix-turn-helix transcriptional regulator [Silvimonas sp.]MDR3430040.1 helix-turn-helix transcriptional regulator [Silvimonas sp.]